MSDEPAKFILGDTAISAIERRGGRRFFGRGKEDRRTLTHCENCGTPLTGRYCPQCGQPAIDYRRSFRHVILDVLDEFLAWDSKILATSVLLIARPWQLTNEFLAGKRVRYLHPLRLYLLASIIFFFAVHYSAKSLHIDNKPLTPEARAEIETQLKNPDLPPVARAALEKRLRKKLKESGPPAAEATAIATATPVEATASPSAKTPTASPQGSVSPAPESQKPSSKRQRSDQADQTDEENDIGIKLDSKEPSNAFERWIESRAKEKIGENGINARIFLASMISNLPYMMLCAIPVFALILKLLYIRRHVLYIDHLIYALHIHTFAYVATMSIILITIGLGRVVSGPLFGWTVAILWCAFAVQIFLSIRKVYRQGWIKSFIKFWLGGVVYFVVLLAGFVATFLITLYSD